MIVSPLVLMMLLASSTCDHSQETTDIATGRVFGSAYDIWEDIYELIIKDYISDVYSDVIETFLGASIKLFGWAAFGTFLVLKGAWLTGSKDGLLESHPYHGQGRAGATTSLTESLLGLGESQGNFTLPYIEQYLGLRLSFPVSDSLQGCYEGRPSCVNNDLPGELGHLMLSASQVSSFLAGWLETGQRLLSLSALEEDSVDVEAEYL